MDRARRQAVLLLALSLACLLASGPHTSLARSTSTNVNGGDSFTAGHWIYYLHNNPTPPTGNTTAQVNLTATATASTTATLYNYDTDCANQAGRGLTLTAPSAGEARPCYYVNWRTAVLAAPLTLRTSVTVDIWSATDTTANKRTGSLIVYVRDFNPAGGTWTEITNWTLPALQYQQRTWIHTPMTIPITGTPTLNPGHQLEIKIEAPTTDSTENMLLAYDTTVYPAFVQLR